MRSTLAVALLASAGVLACGSSPDQPAAPGDAGSDASADAGPDAPSPPADAGADATPPGDAGAYPAFAPDMPRIVDQGGAILSKPEIVTVTWDADPNAATYEAFGDAMGGSSYWSAAVTEYGVGAATSGSSRHVRITSAPPGTMTATALDTLIATQVDGAPGSGWPAATAQSMYVVYVPEATALTDGGQDACNLESGYHDETSKGGNAHIVYAVVVEGCRDKQDVVQFSTEVASHEISETATDPHVQSDLAWTSFDADHYAWELWQGRQDETADACEYYDDAYYQEPALSAWVQRVWSNASGPLGHNPCVPLPTEAYFNATPLGLEDISVTTGKSKTPHATKGLHVPVGQTKTISFGLYSDAPHAAWKVEAVEGDGFASLNNPRLTLSTSKGSGANGDKVDVSVTVNSVGSATGILMTVVSTSNGLSHYMPLLVGAY